MALTPSFGGHLIPELISHTRRVQSLYKRTLRNLESWYDRREVYRYYAVLIRARFEKNKGVQDRGTAKDLLRRGEEELAGKIHWHIRKFPESPGGTAYEREVAPPDWAIDHWHPLEKAQYPDYFAKREEMKKQFIAMWKGKYDKDNE